MVSLALTLVLTLVALAMAGLLLLLWEPKPTEFCVCWKGLVGAEKGALFFGEFVTVLMRRALSMRVERPFIRGPPLMLSINVLLLVFYYSCATCELNSF